MNILQLKSLRKSNWTSPTPSAGTCASFGTCLLARNAWLFCAWSILSSIGLGMASDILQSVAVTDNAMASLVNPAGLAIKRGPNSAIYFRADTTGKMSTINAVTSLGRWGFATTKNNGLRSYVVARGTRISRTIALGTKFGYRSQQASFDLGLQVRPFRFLSLGAASNNLLREDPSVQTQSTTVSIGLRPLCFLTLACDQTWANNQIQQTNASGELRLTKNVLAYTGYQFDTKALSAGLSFFVHHNGLGFERSLTDPSVYAGCVSFSYDLHPSLILPGKTIAEVKVAGILRDADPEFSLFGPEWTSTSSIIGQIRKAAADQSIDGILVSVGDIRAGLGTIEEVRNAMLEAQLAGKRVVCHLDFVGTGEYYLASAASEIAITPTAHWFTPGFGFEVMLYKGLFKKLGVKADFVVAGRYKGFTEPFDADSLSKEFRENEMRILNDWYDNMTERIAIARNVTTEKVDSLIQKGSVRPQVALEQGFVDHTAYYSNLHREIWGKRTRKIATKNRPTYGEVWQGERKIAVILLSGNIIIGNSFTDFFSGTQFLGSNTVVDMIRKARNDRKIGAIVLRIQSGGGSALASDIIWNEIRAVRKKKPIIVSIGNVAASGAYYLACAADTIVANPGSIVGSIGVFGGKFVFQDLYKKLGLKTESIEKGDKANAFSPSRPFSPQEKKMLKKEILTIYQTFKDRVATGRNLDSAAVDSVSEGRIFTGRQAKENGLVDVLGDLTEAIRIARKKANIREKEVKLEIYPKPKGLWSGLQDRDVHQAKTQFHKLISTVERERIWAVAPWYLY